MQPTEFEIRELSYFIWEREGRPESRALDHWVRAEAELRDTQAGTKAARPRRGRPAGAKTATGSAATAGTKRTRR